MNTSYVYCLFDNFSCTYSPVFESKNDKTAVRDVLNSLSKDADLKRFYDETELLCVCKLEKTNNDEFSELKVNIVEDESRHVEWPNQIVKEEVDG